VQYLETAILHPVLNRRLANIGFHIPPDYAKGLVSNEVAAQVSTRTRLIDNPEYYLPMLSLFFTEMTMWDIFPQSELRSRLDFPQAWELTTEILRGTQGIASASPRLCMEMAINTVKTIDNFLVQVHHLEKELYFNRILFPPPPFDENSAESPANKTFYLQLRSLSTESWELEIVMLSNGSPCWSDGPLLVDMVQDRLTLIRTKLQSLNGKDFADFCERFLTTAV
jgi:hypothetical protein